MSARRVKSEKKKQINFSKTFYSDLEVSGMYHAVLVRSPVASGILRSIQLPDPPDMYALFTAKDIPGKNEIPTRGIHIPVFAEHRISYRGEPVGILTGPDEFCLHELLEKIVMRFAPDDNGTGTAEVTVQRTATYGTPPEATAADRTPEQPESGEEPEPDNISLEKTYTSRITFPTFRETCGALVFFQDPAKNNGISLTICTPTQWPGHLRAAVSAATGIDGIDIRIQKTISDTRNTNSIWLNSIVAAQAAVAAFHVGKPVKLAFSRAEQELFSDHDVPIEIKYTALIRGKERIRALDIYIAVKTGAYSPFIAEQLDRILLTAAGLYKPEFLNIQVAAIQTREAPVSADIQLTDAQTFLAIESFMQEASAIAGCNPIAFRLQNSTQAKLPAGVEPKFTFQTEQLPDVIEDVLQKSDFRRKQAVYSVNAKRPADNNRIIGALRGIGFAAGFEGSGFFSSTSDVSALSMEVTLGIDNSVSMHTYLPSSSIQSIWKRIAAECLDVPPEAVFFNSDFSSTEEPLLPSSLTDNISIMTQLLKKCCAAIQRQRFRQPLPITVKRTAGTAKKKNWNQETFSGTPFYSTALAAAVIETEINPVTYENSIRNIWISVDGGAILDMMQAKMTVKKTVQHIIRHIHEKDPADSSVIHLSFVNSSGEPKQIGDIAYNVIPAAYAASLASALNVTHISLPVVQKNIFEILREHAAAGSQNGDDE